MPTKTVKDKAVKSFLTAFAFHVGTTTLVAKLGSTSACHVVAALRLFHPMLAVEALLKLVTPHEVVEGLLIQIRIDRRLILFASLIQVKGRTASQTVPLLTLGACEVKTIMAFLKDESVVAVRGGTPGDVFLDIKGF
jgi:hypothetical protein